MIHLSGLSHKDEANPEGDIEIQFTGYARVKSSMKNY